MGNGYVITHELYKLVHKSLLEDTSILELPDFGRGFTVKLHFLL